MKNNQTKFYWQKILGIFAIVGTVNAISTEAIANPYDSSEVYLAQVGVRSRISSPTPLNLRPRHHIPLPRSNRSNRYNRHRDYRYSEYNDDYYRDRRTNRRHRRRHQSDYDRDIYNQRSRKRRTGGSITIFF